MKRVLTSAILLALTATSAHAVTINLRHEYKPSFGDNDATQADRIAISHRFANGIGFEVETKYKSNTDGDDNAFDEYTQNGTQANISYRYKLSDAFTLTPQYKIEMNSSTTMNNQFNLTLGYKVNSDWSVSYRQRYNYATKANTDGSSHYNQGTFAASYSGLEDWGFGASLDYRWRQEGEDTWKGDKAGVNEVNFTGEYKGFDSGWRPFAEVGFEPTKKYSTDEYKEDFRPRYRVGLKYSF